jgi:lytic murein transglycosylase
MDRRAFLLSLTALTACAEPAAQRGTGPPPPPQPPPLPSSGDAAFDAWRQGFLVQALQAGIAADVLVRELGGVTPDPAVLAADNRQPEFSRPPIAYMTSAVSEGRISAGRDKRAALSFLPDLESRFGVSRDILLGIWAMESAFGAVQGDLDVIRSLATLAFEGRRREWAEGELKAALRMIVGGLATRPQLKGSWAGAMGQTQFLPSTYLSTAVDGDGDGRRDIWGSAADALASAATLLARAGWVRGQGWAWEVILPAGFDYALADGPREPWAAWAARGVRLAAGAPWTAAEQAAGAALLLPAGHTGPAFLALPNHFIIRRYNNSTLYALGVGLLADRFAGGGPLVTPWPQEAPMSLADRRAAQVALRRAGFDPGEPDGLIGTRTRTALRAWQQARGLPADGYLSADMVERLSNEMVGQVRDTMTPDAVAPPATPPAASPSP